MPDMRRQPVTLHENLHLCNTHWDRTKDMLWRCMINSCSSTFVRKAGLVKHRMVVHNLGMYEANVPDQRLQPEHDVGALWKAAESFAEPTGRTSFPASFVRSDLRSNGSRFEGGPTDFADCDLDTIQNMIFYGLRNGYFDAHPSMCLELLAAQTSRLCQALERQTPAQDTGPTARIKSTRVSSRHLPAQNSRPSKRTKSPPPVTRQPRNRGHQNGLSTCEV